MVTEIIDLSYIAQKYPENGSAPHPADFILSANGDKLTPTSPRVRDFRAAARVGISLFEIKLLNGIHSNRTTLDRFIPSVVKVALTNPKEVFGPHYQRICMLGRSIDQQTFEQWADLIKKYEDMSKKERENHRTDTHMTRNHVISAMKIIYKNLGYNQNAAQEVIPIIQDACRNAAEEDLDAKYNEVGKRAPIVPAKQLLLSGIGFVSKELISDVYDARFIPRFREICPTNE